MVSFLRCRKPARARSYWSKRKSNGVAYGSTRRRPSSIPSWLTEGMRLLPLRRLLCSLMAERDTSAGVISSSQPYYCWGTLLASPMPMTRRERDLRKQTNRAAVSVSDKRGTVRMKAAGHLLCFLAWGKKENHASAGSRGFCFSHFLADNLFDDMS